VAWYPLTEDVADASNNYADMELLDISEPDGSLRGDGTYPHGALTPGILSLNESSFEIDVEFKVNHVTSEEQNPIIVGGQAYRWIGIQIGDSGKIGILYNNFETNIGEYSGDQY
jgi:hypothetical protein